MRRFLRSYRLAAVFGIVALAMSTASAHAAVTLPPRKPGLWVTTMLMKMTMPGMPAQPGDTPITSAMCTDAATDAEEMKMMGGESGKCAKFDLEGSGDTYTMDGSCPDPMDSATGGTGMITTHGVITRNSDTEFHMVSQTTSSHMSGSMTADSKWVGACPAGTVAGDVGSMQNGQFVKRTNILTAPPAAPPQ